MGLATGSGGEIEKLDMKGFDGFGDGDGLEGLAQGDQKLGGRGFGLYEGAVDLAPLSRFKSQGEGGGLGLEVVAVKVSGEFSAEFGKGLVNFVSVFGQPEGFCAADEGAGVVGFDGVMEGAVSGLVDEHPAFGKL